MYRIEELLNKSGVTSSELEELLRLREEGKADFLLVDVREEFEYEMGHIKGVDMLKPTSMFQSWAREFLDKFKDKVVIFTCRTDNRSGQVAQIFSQNGLKAINHLGGIVSYYGEIVN